MTAVHEDEKVICEISPSQIINIKTYIWSLVAAAVIITVTLIAGNNLILLALIIPVTISFWKWLEIKNMKLKLTDQRLIMRHGVLNKSTNETELYRVRDSSIEEPFFYRMFGCGNIIIYTTDEAGATVQLKAYKKPHWVKDQVRNYSEICRQNKRWGADNIILHDPHNL